MRHTVAISDIHLSQLEPSGGLWMRYRQAPFIPDHELVPMLRALRERVRGEELELVLNGDIFDFDAPWNENGKTRLPDVRRDAAIAVPIMHGIVRDHQEFFAALGGLLTDGHALVFVSGNHDVEMTLEEVRAVIRDALLDAAQAAGAVKSRDALASQLMFRGWFHMTRDAILFEHGHQYDETNSYRTIMAPFDRSGKNIAPTLGALSTRYFGTRLGYFNPNVDESYMLTFWGYVRHWIKYYLFSTRSIVKAFLKGVVRTVIELIKNRGDATVERRAQNAEAAIAEMGIDRQTIERHLALAARPVEENLRQLVRDLGIDRLAFGSLAVILAVVWIHLANGWHMAGAVFPPALLLGYSIAVPRRSSLDGLWHDVQLATKKLADIYRAKAVIFGHTHHASGSWEHGVFFGNTGSWSAAYRDVECTQPLQKERPLIWLTKKDETSPLEGGLMTWKDGGFTDNQNTASSAVS